MSKLEELIRQSIELAEQLDENIGEIERLPPHLSGHLRDIKHWLSVQLHKIEQEKLPGFWKG